MIDFSQVSAFYHPDPVRPGDLVTLDSDEERHLRAHRLRPGAPLLLLDGKGERRHGVIERTDRRGSLIRIESIELASREGGPYIALGIALLSDRPRLEWVVEKGTELGLAEVIFMETERSEGRYPGDRLHRIATAALKQSRRSFLPDLRPPASFDHVLNETRSYDRTFMCHEEAPVDESLARILADQPQSGRILLLIGPEGGFTRAEVDRARDARANVVSLGPARLRAETAAVAATVLATSLVIQTPHRV